MLLLLLLFSTTVLCSDETKTRVFELFFVLSISCVFFFLFWLLFTNEWFEVLVNSFHLEVKTEWLRKKKKVNKNKEKRNYLNMCWRWILIRQVNVESTQFTSNIFFHRYTLDCSCKVIKRNYTFVLPFFVSPFQFSYDHTSPPR